MKTRAYQWVFSIMVAVGMVQSSVRLSQAQGQSGEFGSTQGLTNPLESSGVRSLPDLLQKIIDYMTLIAGPILMIMLLYGAFKILTARDNPSEYQKGITTIKNAAIGFGIILIGWGFVYVIQEFLGVPTS